MTLRAALLVWFACAGLSACAPSQAFRRESPQPSALTLRVERAQLVTLTSDDPDAVVRAWDDVLALDDTQLEAHQELAKVLTDLGEYDEALDHCERVLAVASDQADPETLLALAGVLEERDLLLDATRYWDAYVSIRKGDAAAHAHLGSLLSAYQQTEAAEWHFREAIQLDPEDHRAMNDLGALLVDQREAHREAERLFLQAHSLAPDNATYAYNLGMAYELQGKWKDAETAYRLSLRLNAREGDTYYRLAQVLKQQGRARDAREILLKGRRVAPAAVNWSEAIKGL